MNVSIILSMLVLVSSPGVGGAEPIFGVVWVNGDMTCVAFDDKADLGGSNIKIVSENFSGRRVLEGIVGKPGDACTNVRSEARAYTLDVTDEEKPWPVSIGVISEGDLQQARDDTWVLDTVEGGVINLRTCTSGEGLHMSAWRGGFPEGERVWHAYHYLGYNVDATCTEEDFQGLE